MRQSAFLAAILPAIPLVAASPKSCGGVKWTVGQKVQTTSGPVEGHAASDAPGVSEYLGIPYAQPPVGGLRFQPPVRYNGTEAINGGSFGPGCISSHVNAPDAEFPPELVEKYGITEYGLMLLGSVESPGIPASEDCLTLNVWTKPQSGERRKAVLVFIHGGSFVSGSSSLPIYNGQFFADQEDVVLVTLNYRLSLFGFPGNPHGVQNLGLLDQRMAVEWVRDNIAAFGGDPGRITLFGESAGAISLDYYSFAWAEDPIAHALIIMSGTTSIRGPDPDGAAALWYNATAALNCGDASTPPDRVLSCMLSVPAESIAAVLTNTVTSPVPNPYCPVVDDRLVFPPDAAPAPARLPLLIGNTDNEAGFFRLFDPPGVPRGDAFWHEFNQNTFTCPAAARAALSAAQGSPTWRYRWHGAFGATELSTNPPSGAYHFGEMAPLFGTLGEVGVGEGEAAEIDKVAGYMRRAWATFAKDPVKGLKRELGWLRYDMGGEAGTLVRIGVEGEKGASLVRGDLYDEGCGVEE